MNPLIPMFAITGRPAPSDICAKLNRFYQSGIRQVMLYPRSGCGIPYMSDEWRAVCAAGIDFAKKHGMKIWLYDEFNWPSGSCKNEVTRTHPEFVARYYIYEGDALRISAPEMDEVSHTYEQFCADLLNPAAVDCFLALTHERYFRWFGAEFGGTIPGIFTDEPSFGYLTRAANRLPYYDGIAADFRARYGAEIEPGLRAYFRGEPCDAFCTQYWAMIAARFRETYFARIGAWCCAHRLQMTGHCMSDSAIANGIHLSGNVMENLDCMDMPGIDEIDTHFCAGDDLLFAQLQNVRAHGATHAMAELFALGPVSMAYARMRQMIWYAAAHGVDHYFMAIAHLDGRGNWIKDNFFHDFAPESPDFVGAAALGASAEEAAAFSGRAARMDADIALRYPFTVGAQPHAEPDAPDAQFKACIDALRQSQLAWKLIRENEATDCARVIRLLPDGLAEETTGAHYADGASCAAALAAQVGRRIWVTDSSGAPDPDVLVKSYADGSWIVVDASNTARPRDLVLHRAGTATPFRLEAFGVVRDTDLYSTPVRAFAPIPVQEIHRPYGNLYRIPLLDASEADFTLAEPMKLEFYGRIYPEAGAILLDGAPLAFDRPSDGLTDCFNGLYRKTAAMQLDAGRHTVQSDLPDKCFLPVVIAAGEFDIDAAGRLTAQPGDAPGFMRTAVVTFTAAIPAEGRDIALEYADNQRVASLRIDGADAGVQAFAPYRFPIPARLAGRTVQFELTLYSSLAPIFGTFDRNACTARWGNFVSAAERVELDDLRLTWTEETE